MIKMSLKQVVLLFITIVTVVPAVYSARILFLLPLSCRSEVNSIHPLAMELLSRGHHVTWVTSLKTSGANNLQNYMEIVPIPPPNIEDFVGTPSSSILELRANFVKLIPHLLSWNLTVLATRCHAVYNDPTFQAAIFSPTANYDLVIINGNLHHCLLGIIPLLLPSPPPFIVYTTIPFTGEEIRLTGLRMPSAFVPSSNLPFTKEMTFFQRLFNFIHRMTFTFFLTSYVEHVAESQYTPHLINKTGEKKLPSISEIQGDVAMVFSNSHPSLSNPRPLTPDIVEVGCLHCREGAPLPVHLHNYMEDSRQGVILFSMGSMFSFSSFPPQLRDDVMTVFSRMNPIRVLFVGQEIANMTIPRNVMMTPWIPQQDILAHKNLQLFISHGGIQSHLEAAYHGVPVVALPIYSDQAFAAAHVQLTGNGIGLELLDLSKDTFEEGIREVLTNPRYKSKAKELSVIFKDQPETPLQRAVFWTEYIIRHKGAKHLRTAARKFNAFQYYDVDLVLFIITFCAFGIWFGFKFLAALHFTKAKYAVAFLVLMAIITQLITKNLFINLSVNKFRS